MFANICVLLFLNRFFPWFFFKKGGWGNTVFPNRWPRNGTTGTWTNAHRQCWHCRQQLNLLHGSTNLFHWPCQVITSDDARLDPCCFICAYIYMCIHSIECISIYNVQINYKCIKHKYIMEIYILEIFHINLI